MGDIVPIRPIRWGALRQDEAEREVRARAQKRGNVIITDHAFDRVEGREITEPDVIHILRTGHVEVEMERLSGNDWKVLVTKRMKGRREAGVATIILREDKLLIVKTVEWVD